MWGSRQVSMTFSHILRVFITSSVCGFGWALQVFLKRLPLFRVKTFAPDVCTPPRAPLLGEKYGQCEGQRDPCLYPVSSSLLPTGATAANPAKSGVGRCPAGGPRRSGFHSPSLPFTQAKHIPGVSGSIARRRQLLFRHCGMGF